jgi:hypothetical protein
MAKVTGIGGVFIRTEQNKELIGWLKEHLNIAMQDWGGTQFFWGDLDNAGRRGCTVLNVAEAGSQYFAPSTLPVMINLRVDNLEEMLAALSQRGISPVRREDDPHGRFAHVMAPGGLKIELWEPAEDDPEESSGDVKS